jgi:hypothetical protein
VTLKEKRMLSWFFMPTVGDLSATGGSASCKKKYLKSRTLMPNYWLLQLLVLEMTQKYPKVFMRLPLRLFPRLIDRLQNNLE